MRRNRLNEKRARKDLQRKADARLNKHKQAGKFSMARVENKGTSQSEIASGKSHTKKWLAGQKVSRHLSAMGNQ